MEPGFTTLTAPDEDFPSQGTWAQHFPEQKEQLSCLLSPPPRSAAVPHYIFPVTPAPVSLSGVMLYFASCRIFHIAFLPRSAVCCKSWPEVGYHLLLCAFPAAFGFLRVQGGQGEQGLSTPQLAQNWISSHNSS